MPVNREEEVFLVIRTTKGEMRQIRKLIHEQPWYKGDDVPLRSPRDFFGIPTDSIIEILESYWAAWKERAAQYRQLRGK